MRSFDEVASSCIRITLKIDQQRLRPQLSVYWRWISSSTIDVARNRPRVQERQIQGPKDATGGLKWHTVSERHETKVDNLSWVQCKA